MLARFDDVDDEANLCKVVDLFGSLPVLNYGCGGFVITKSANSQFEFCHLIIPVRHVRSWFSIEFVLPDCKSQRTQIRLRFGAPITVPPQGGKGRQLCGGLQCVFRARANL